MEFVDLGSGVVVEGRIRKESRDDGRAVWEVVYPQGGIVILTGETLKHSFERR